MKALTEQERMAAREAAKKAWDTAPKLPDADARRLADKWSRDSASMTGDMVSDQ